MDLEKKLDNGVFLTLTEFITPKGTDVAAMVENADQVRGIAALKEEGFSGTLLATAGWERRLPEIFGLQLKDAFYSATKEV